MPIARPHCRGAGFTLIEILVVVVIIAAVTTIAVLSVGALGKDRGLDDEGDRFTDVVAAATEQAGLEGRDYGIWFGPDRYEVMAYAQRRQRWETIADDRLYDVHEFAAGVLAELEIEGRPIMLQPARPDSPQVPQVMLYAGGDSSSYRLRLSREGAETHFNVEGHADGTLTVTRPGATP